MVGRWLILVYAAVSILSSSARPEELRLDDDKTLLSNKDSSRPWTGEFGVDSVSAYFAFGILQENQGLIAQPYFNLHFDLQSDEASLISDFVVGLELWSSIHSARPAEEDTGTPWYEFDYSFPVALTISKLITLTISYLDYESPNGSFENERAVSVNIVYDDTDLLGQFALHPHITALYNFEGVVGLGQSNAIYLEFGVEPSCVVGAKSSCPLTLSFPLAVGFGDSHFYPHGAYGFFSAGLTASIPIPFLSKTGGDWDVNMGATYYSLGTDAAIVNGGNYSWVTQIGIGFKF